MARDTRLTQPFLPLLRPVDPLKHEMFGLDAAKVLGIRFPSTRRLQPLRDFMTVAYEVIEDWGLRLQSFRVK